MHTPGSRGRGSRRTSPLLYRKITVRHIGSDGAAALSGTVILGKIRSREGIHAHSLVSLHGIKVADALDIGIGKRDAGIIARHLRLPAVPTGKIGIQTPS